MWSRLVYLFCISVLYVYHAIGIRMCNFGKTSCITKEMNALAVDYARYWEVNVPTELASVDEALEDILTRLEEFKSLVDMVKHEDCYQMTEPLARLRACQTDVDSLVVRIDSLGLLVDRARHDIDKIEKDLNAAEADSAANGKLKNILKPLFFKKSEHGSTKVGKSPPYEAPEIFSASEFFSSQEELKK